MDTDDKRTYVHFTFGVIETFTMISQFRNSEL